MIALSVLDLAPILEGGTAAEAFERSRDLACAAESWGYRRFWLAEHHNMVGIASAATSVVIGYVAAATRRIRVGSGGIMLPNHPPLVIAEQFGTLDALFPGRIDLGLGRAPGTDMATLRALRRSPDAADTFPQDVIELQALLGPVRPGQIVQAVPGAGSKVPLWILGSSLFGAELAGVLGLPYAFAAHFAPGDLDQALALYRRRFEASDQLDRPHAMPCINVVVADTDAEAARLFTSLQLRFLGILRNQRGYLAPPVSSLEGLVSPGERRHLDRMLAGSIVGGPASVRDQLARFRDRTEADEIMVAAPIFDASARLRSYERLAEIAAEL